MALRLKFYGWGYEGEGLDEAERARLVRFVGEKLGAAPRAAASPPQAAEIALRAPRISAPAALVNVLSADAYKQLAQQSIETGRPTYRLEDPRLFDDITTQKIPPGPGPTLTENLVKPENVAAKSGADNVR